MTLKETTKYNLLESRATPSFDLIIEKEEVNPMVLISITESLCRNEIGYKVFETKDNTIVFEIIGATCSGRFKRTVKELKKKVFDIMAKILTKHDLNVDMEVKKTLDVEDVYGARFNDFCNKVTKLKEGDFYLRGNPNNFLTKNNDLRSLCIVFGHIGYCDTDFNPGVLGEALKSLTDKYKISAYSSERVDLANAKIEIEDILNLMNFLKSNALKK